MSTKIYNGYRYQSTDGTAADVFRLAQRLRDALQPVVTGAYRHRAVEAAVRNLDNGRSDGTAPIIAAERYLAEAARKAASSGQRDPRNDFSCRIAILADDTHPDTLYLLTYCEIDITTAMCDICGVDEYRYYDNTDRPDTIDADTWAERGRDWNRVLGYDTPAERGLICELGDPSFTAMLGDRDALEPYIPDRNTRAQRIAVEGAIDRAVSDASETGPSEIIRIADDARRRALDDHDTIAAIADSIDEIGVDDLYRSHR